MMKKLILMVTAGLACAMVVRAATETVGGIRWTYTVLNGGVRITAAASSDANAAFPTDVAVPASLGNLPVRELGTALRGKDVVRVEIPNTVTNLMMDCFDGCGQLTAVVGGDNVARIDYAAFRNCASLCDFDLPAGLTYIGERAFMGCSLLRGIHVPGGVRDVPFFSFNLGSAVVFDSIRFDEGVETVELHALESTSATNLYLPSSLTSFDMFDSSSLKKIQNLYISSLSAWCGVSHSGSSYNPIYYVPNVYFGGDLLRDVLTIPEGVREIKGDAFVTLAQSSSAMAFVRSVVLPNSLERIGVRGLSLPNVTNVVFGAREVEFEPTSLALKNVKTLTIPATWKTLSGLGVLGSQLHARGCVKIAESNPYITEDAYGIYSDGGTCLEMVYGQNTTNYTVPEGITRIADGAFSALSCTNVSFASTVVSIGRQALAYNSNIKRLVLPPGIKNISERMLLNCFSLESVVIPEGVTNIGDSAFFNCRSLKSITLPTGLQSIGEGAFSGCVGLENIDLPETLTDIGKDAFTSCTSLKSLTLPTGLRRIGDYAFNSCSALTGLVIPNTVTSIGIYAFERTSLTEIEIPDSVVSVGTGVFYEANALTNLVVGASVVGTGNLMYGMTKGCLQSVTFKSVNGYMCGSSSAVPPFLRRFTLPEGFVQSRWWLGNTNENVEVELLAGTEAFTTAFFVNAPVYKSRVRTLVIPSSVTNVQVAALAQLVSLEKVVFDGCPSSVLTDEVVEHLRSSGIAFSYENPSPSGPGDPTGDDPGQIAEKLAKYPSVKVLSSTMRKSDPTILDVTFAVSNTAETAEVRVLAFKDGVRSFANVLRPVSFADGTCTNVGVVAANRTYALAWKIPEDWDVDLGRVTFEVLMTDQGVLPLRLVTIPTIGNRAGLKFSRNAISGEKTLNALLWHYAGGADDLSLADGVLTSGGKALATGATPTADGVGYLFGKLGYGILSGADLEYVNRMTRLGLAPSGTRQYAVKPIE